MFRGSALIDDNIMAMYTTPATEAKHYVQYDQGKLFLLVSLKTTKSQVRKAHLSYL